LPERFSVSVPPVASDICRSAVLAPKYLPERRSTAFPHHYTPVCTLTTWHCPRCLPRAALLCAPCSNRSMFPASQATQQLSLLLWPMLGQTDRLTDARQIHRPCSHTVRALPVILSCCMFDVLPLFVGIEILLLLSLLFSSAGSSYVNGPVLRCYKTDEICTGRRL